MRSSLLNPVNPSSPELPRLLCAFHPEEQLTNFCKSKECLLPLCPACVSIHVGEHITAKTNPELQHINDSIRDLHSNLDTYTLQLNALYKHLVQAQGKVQEFRETLREKLNSAKQDLIESVEDHFKRLQMTTLSKIDELKYVKTLGKYKELAKKMILSLKNTQRNFFAEESKVSRMIIKFESNQIREHLDCFCKETQQFVAFPSLPPLSFTLKDSALSLEYLQNTLQLQIQQPTVIHQPKDIVHLIKELYEKPSEKKETKKYFQKLASYKNTPSKPINPDIYREDNQRYETLEPAPIRDFSEVITGKQDISYSQMRPLLSDLTQNQLEFDFVKPHCFNSLIPNAYSSVKESIVKATKDFNQTITRNSRLQGLVEPVRGRRPSLSKGKGITLIQQGSTMMERGPVRSFLRGELDLSLISSNTEKIPRKYR